MDESVDSSRSERRAALAQIHDEYIANGNTGPGIRQSANELGRRYEALARQLFDLASRQPDAARGHLQVIDRLREEYERFRAELTEVVTGVEGGNAALGAALEILDRARDQVDGYLQNRAVRDTEWVSPWAAGHPALVAEGGEASATTESVRTDDGNYLLTEDGEVILTEDGEPIELEDTRVTEDGDTRFTENGDVRVSEDDDARLTGDSDSRVAEQVTFGDKVEGEVVPAVVRASGWTGHLSHAERVEVIKSLGPVAQIEIQALIESVADRRFNDELTQDALEQLRRLHGTLGQLIEAADRGKPLDDLLAAFGQDRDKFFGLLKQGANVVVAAPAMTFGMVHLLSALFGVPIDTTMVAGVYALMMQKLRRNRKG